MSSDRDATQAVLGKLSAATLQHTPSQTYSVADRLEERAEAEPGRPFILFEDRTLSYGEINATANRIARVLREHGVGFGDTVALMMGNRPEFIASWAALAKLGVTAALINTHARGKALGHALQLTGARHWIVGDECADAAATLPASPGEAGGLETWRSPDPHPEPGRSSGPTGPLAGARDLVAAAASMSDANLDPTCRADLRAGRDLFYIFTSGTTGLPKAARLSHMRFLGVGDGMSAVAGYGPDDVIACVLPLYHGAGGMVVVSCALSHGARIFLRRRFSASAFWDDARKYGVTGWQYVGEVCRYLVNQPARDDDRDHPLRVMMGAGLGPDIWTAFQERFAVSRVLEGWSSTEANTSLLNVDNRAGSCGRIPFKELHNGRLVRFDVESETHPRSDAGFLIECEPGEVGEFIGMVPDLPDSGAGRFEGYTSKEATDNKLLRGVFAEGDCWYRSGDLLRRDEDDFFYFVDRIGDTYRWKSENVSTQEVAEALTGFPGLQIANVYGVAVPGNEGRAGMASLVLADPASFDASAFYRWTEERLASYAAPLFVRIASEADLTTTFKLRKVEVQREGYHPERIHDPLYVRDPGALTYVALDPESLQRLGIPPSE